MRYRELKLRPVPGSVAADGAVRVFRVAGDATAFAVLRGEVYRATKERVAKTLHDAGFKGVLLDVPPGTEFTLCEVEDGEPARWQEDGRPSYAEMEQRVKELEAMGPSSSYHGSFAGIMGGADCGPRCVVKLG